MSAEFGTSTCYNKRSVSMKAEYFLNMEGNKVVSPLILIYMDIEFRS